MEAVLTADMIDSSQYPADLLEQLIQVLQDESRLLDEEDGSIRTFGIWRGDSFQAELLFPGDALSVALRFYARVRSMVLPSQPKQSLGASKSPADIRIGIGLGEATLQRNMVAESNGPVYWSSGSELDRLKKKDIRLGIRTPYPELDAEFKVHTTLLDYILVRWSVASAEAVYWLLRGRNETEIADILGISQPAVNARKKASGWEGIQAMIERFEDRIRTLQYS